jgi:3-hydroxybutyrate dehydrogenase
LINNAGIQHTCPIESFPEEMYLKLISLHLHAPFFAIQEALPHMRKQKWGRIINTGVY